MIGMQQRGTGSRLMDRGEIQKGSLFIDHTRGNKWRGRGEERRRKIKATFAEAKPNEIGQNNDRNTAQDVNTNETTHMTTG